MKMVSILIDEGRCDVKLKRILCMVLVCLLSMGFFCVPVEASDNINLQTGFIDVYATGRFSLDIPAGGIRAAKSSFPLEAGEVVTIKGAYSPFSASVDFGLIAPNGRFYYLNSKDGSLNGAIEVDERGQYTLAIRNNSSETISVSGYVNYYTPSTTYETGSWASIYHNVGSSHTDHFVCPFVKNTYVSSNDQSYYIGGEIWVNYTNSWS